MRVRSALADVTAGTYAHGTALSRALGRTRVAAVRVTHVHMTKSNSRSYDSPKGRTPTLPSMRRACDTQRCYSQCMRLCGVICRWVGG